MERDEEMLVSQAAPWASTSSPGRSPTGSSWPTPTGPTTTDEERRATRDVYLEASFSGMWLGQMTLDPISGAIVAGELDRLEHGLFEADCAEATSAWGGARRVDELARNAGQRRADALVEMARG